MAHGESELHEDPFFGGYDIPAEAVEFVETRLSKVSKTHMTFDELLSACKALDTDVGRRELTIIVRYFYLSGGRADSQGNVHRCRLADLNNNVLSFCRSKPGNGRFNAIVSRLQVRDLITAVVVCRNGQDVVSAEICDGNRGVRNHPTLRIGDIAVYAAADS